MSVTFFKTVGNTCFMFYTILSVMLFVFVSSVCTLMFLVLERMFASYFIDIYDTYIADNLNEIETTFMKLNLVDIV